MKLSENPAKGRLNNFQVEEKQQPGKYEIRQWSGIRFALLKMNRNYHMKWDSSLLHYSY